MNANRMYSLAVAAVVCCSPVYAQLGTSNGSPAAQTGSTPQRGAQGTASDTTNAQATAQSDPTRDLTNQSGPAQDKVFVKKALEGSMAEVQLGQLALQKSNDEQVKQFGQKMVDDHSKLIDQMKPVAQMLGVPVPSSPSKAQLKTMDKLKGLSGDAFDQAYIKDMVKDHKEDDADFKHEASTTKNVQLREVVQQGDQVIQMHLEHIQQIAKSKGTTRAKS